MLTPLFHRSYQKLFDYFRPQDDRFHPLPSSRTQSQFRVQGHAQATSGNITPLPDPREVSSSTPAWDPSSRTPGWTPSPSSTPAWDPSSRTPGWTPSPALTSTPAAADSHSPTEQAVPMEHVLFDPRLLNIKLKVKFTGGVHSNKEGVIAPSTLAGRPVLPYSHYKTCINYPPEWVSVIQPNVTRDEGLLVVIKGEHCGKYIRRVHFRYGSDNIPIADLAVVHHTEGAKDSLTGERLELTADNLGSVVEAPSDKALNKGLITALRTERRKIRAK
jgi:hypothetical protein